MNHKTWLTDAFDEETKKEILRLEKEDPKALKDAFYQELSFGTGGMRGLMGVGTNRMNTYTIRFATQGLASYLLLFSRPHRVFIGYDVRKNSRSFAEETARVLAGNGIEAWIAKTICPTPLTSFACRHFGCQAAVMITASHNPPAYNGYKVYWQDGGQIVFPHDQGIIQEVRKKAVPKLAPLHSPLIRFVGEELDQAYLNALSSLDFPEKAPIKILYSPLHGTGTRIVLPLLRSHGYSVDLLDSQSAPDPLFSTVSSPNPEEKEALSLGTAALVQGQYDLFLATDPDADRVGAVVQGPHLLNGHEIACLLLDSLLSSLKSRGKLPSNGVVIKSIVTTEMFRKIAESYGIACIEVLTGFKYIAEQIELFEKEGNGQQFLFGAEESYGYLAGTAVRDKDAAIASLLLAHAASVARSAKRTLTDQMKLLSKQHGTYKQALINLSFADTAEGQNKRRLLMEQLRSAPPTHLEIVQVDDFLKETNLPKTDMLRYTLKTGATLIVRPSGTEPKIKFYLETQGDIEALKKACLSLY
jgi:phosphoglucomutase/phosphomannomutase